jgi:hypothetical protein
MHRNPVKRGLVLELPVAVEQLPLVRAGRDGSGPPAPAKKMVRDGAGERPHSSQNRA